MSRYIALYHAPLDVAQRFAQATPKEAALGLQDWIDWSAKLGPALVDPGQPLGNAKLVTSAGVTRRPRRHHRDVDPRGRLHG
ncbi:hypothetical protein [Glaciihabitans sp. UYNi722]|uniref:hypothetical protein n=1 Tax=Glaciihabitans sp. UYNi722 TaxID=3156344 RepID=UPI00339B8783